MQIPKTKKFDNKTYTLSPVGHRSKRSAQSYANDLRRNGYSARVVGNAKVGWFVYKRG